MKRALAGAVLALASMWTPAQADTPACQYSAAPTISLGFSNDTQAGTNLKDLVEHWKVNCSTNCPAQAIKFWDGIQLVYASEMGTEISGTDTLGAGQDTSVTAGDTVVTYPLRGVKIVPIFKAGCGDGVTGTDLIQVQGDPIVMPPYLPTEDQINVFVDDPNYHAGLPVVPATKIPMNMKFHVQALIEATPKGSEGVTVSLVGAGINFTKTYLAGNGEIGDQLGSDPDAQFTATSTDPINFTVTFEGTSSPTRHLTAVVVDASGNPETSSGGTSGGTGNTGDTGTSASPPSASKKSGCEAAGPGATLLSLLALSGLRRRRA